MTREDVARLAGQRARAAGTSWSPATSWPSRPRPIRTRSPSCACRRARCCRASGASTTPSSSWPRSTTPSRTTCARRRRWSRCIGRPGASQDVLEIYRKRQDVEPDPRVRRELAYHIAALTESRAQAAGRGHRALPADRRRVRRRRGRRLPRARAALRSAGRYADLAETLSRRIDLGPTTDEELAALKFRLARVKQEHLEQIAEAVELYREILLLVPEHEGALLALETLLADPQHGARRPRSSSRCTSPHGQWEELVRRSRCWSRRSPEPERGSSC